MKQVIRSITLFSALLTGVFMTPVHASAQAVLSEPACFAVRNTAPYMVTGTISTDYYERPDGIRARHRSNFRLEPQMSEEFCASGPFYPGWKLELTLRTLVPVFSCKTQIDQGEITIKGEIKPDGTTNSSATCF
jgi:hypothetical protein